MLLETAEAEAAAGVAAGLEATSGKKARVEAAGSWSEDDDGAVSECGGGRRRRCSGEGAARPAAEGAEGAEDGDEDRGGGRLTAMASIDSRLANCCMSNAIGWLSSRPQPSLGAD